MERRILIVWCALLLNLLILGACSTYKETTSSSALPMIEAAEWRAKSKVAEWRKPDERYVNDTSNMVSTVYSVRNDIPRLTTRSGNIVNQKELVLLTDTVHVKSAQEAWELHRGKVGEIYFIIGAPLAILFLISIIGIFALTPVISLTWIGLIYMSRGSKNILNAIRNIKVMSLIILILNIVLLILTLNALLIAQSSNGIFTLEEFFEIALIITIIGFIVSTALSLASWGSIVRFGRKVGLLPPKPS